MVLLLSATSIISYWFHPRLTERGNARSEQLLVMPAESLTNREWLPGELLSGLERRMRGWFLDM